MAIFLGIISMLVLCLINQEKTLHSCIAVFLIGTYFMAIGYLIRGVN